MLRCSGSPCFFRALLLSWALATFCASSAQSRSFTERWIPAAFYGTKPPTTFPYLTAYHDQPTKQKAAVRETVRHSINPQLQALSYPKSTQLMYWPIERSLTDPIVVAKRSFYPESMQDTDHVQRYLDKRLTDFVGHDVWRQMYATCCGENQVCRQDMASAPLKGDWSQIVLKHLDDQHPAQKLLAHLISGTQVLISLKTCSDPIFLTAENRTACIARKVLPYESRLFFLAAFVQQGLKASVPFWPTDDQFAPYLKVTNANADVLETLHALHRSLQAMPPLKQEALTLSAFSPQSVDWLKSAMQELFKVMRYDPKQHTGIHCDTCSKYAHKHFAAIGTLFSLLFEPLETAKMTPFQLQAVLLTTRFVSEAMSPFAYCPSSGVSDFETKGNFISDRLDELTAQQVAAEAQWRAQHPTQWQRFRSQLKAQKSNAVRGAAVPFGGALSWAKISA